MAARWADLHPPESIHDAASFSMTSCGREHEEPIAGEGAPLVAEFCFAAAVETPRTPPSSAKQKSATHGAPSPAIGSSCSDPRTVKAAAEWIDSGGCRSAHCAARTSWRAAAAFSISREALIVAISAEAVRSSTSPAPVSASASIMCSILLAITDTDPL